MGIQYRFIWLYRLLIKIIHNKKVRRALSDAVGSNKTVFEVACGFGLNAGYIDKSNTYSGIDLNERFIRYAKNCNLNVNLGDVFDAKSYKHSDVLVLVDIIHHMPEERLTGLFDNIFTFADQKVVILEPSFVGLKQKYGIFGSAVDWIFRKLDSDGINTIERWYTEAEYNKMFKTGFDSKGLKNFSVSVEKVWPYNLVTYSRKLSKRVTN